MFGFYHINYSNLIISRVRCRSMGPGHPRSELFFLDFLDFHHFSPSMTVTTRTLLAFALACINCNALAHSSASHMYLRPHRTLRFDSRLLLCQTTTNATLLGAIDRRKKMCHQDFLQHHCSPQSAAARHPARSARTLWTPYRVRDPAVYVYTKRAE